MPLYKLTAAVNRRELIFTGVAGFVGGIVGWLPVEAVVHDYVLGEHMSAGFWLLYYFTNTALAALIGAFVIAAEGCPASVTTAVRRRLRHGFLATLVPGFLAVYLSNRLFAAILILGGVRFGAVGKIVEGSILTLLFARAVAWSIWGALMGLGIGMVSLNPTKILKGAVGGFMGGFFGGISFDPVNAITGGGMAARFWGFGAQGCLIGLAIGLVQEITKTAWLTVDAGRLRGRQFRLDKAAVILGRAEESDVGLFGDPSVLPTHAQLMRVGAEFELSALARNADIRVNGSSVSAIRLNDGDRIELGRYVLTFHCRTRSDVLRQKAFSAAPPAVTPSVTASTTRSAFLLDSAGRTISISPGVPLQVGRDSGNDVSIPDESVSRRHAVITLGARVTFLRDLSSSNGTFVNDRRVSEMVLKDGDSIRFGDVSFIFRQSAPN